MRKFLLSFFAAVFLMCSAMPVSAVSVKSAAEKGISEIEIGGELLTKGWLFDETYTEHKPSGQRNPDGRLKSDRSHSYWQTNFLLETAYTASEDLKAVWTVEVRDIIWGDDSTGGGLGTSTGSQDHVKDNNSSSGNIRTYNLYVDFKVPNTPIRTKVGLQDFTLGHGVVLNGAVGGVNFSIDADPLEVNLFTFKTDEGDTDTADDVDYYGLSTNASLGDAGSIGIFGIWGRTSDAANARGAFDANYDVDDVIAGNETTSHFRSYDAYWLGLTADLALDPIEIQFEADVYQAVWDSHSGHRDYRASGWFTWLDLGFNMGDMGKAGIAGFMASGNSNDSYRNSTSTDGNPGNYSNNNFDQIYTWDRTDGCILGWDNLFIRDGVAYNRNEEDAVVPYSDNDNQIRNMYSAKLYTNLNPTDWLKVGVNVNAYWKANGFRGSEDGEDTYYGTEFDLDLAIQIYDQLTWSIEGGYMLVSDNALDNNPQEARSAIDNAIGTRNDEDSHLDNTNIWAVVSGLTYSF